jgi:hypothetical protein
LLSRKSRTCQARRPCDQPNGRSRHRESSTCGGVVVVVGAGGMQGRRCERHACGLLRLRSVAWLGKTHNRTVQTITRLQNTRMARGSDDWHANEGQEPQCIHQHARSLNSQAVIEAHAGTSACNQARGAWFFHLTLTQAASNVLFARCVRV